jgi:Tfp pilus assembly protein PilF
MSSKKQLKQFIKDEKWTEAKEHCESILEDEADNFTALLFLGLAFQNLKDYSKGEAAFRKAIEVNRIY